VPQPRSAFAAFLIFACVAMVFIAARYFDPGLNYVFVTLFLTAILFVLGATITARPLGFLVNEQNVMSLARFQLAAGPYWCSALISPSPSRG